jgi:hypothetical protein
MRDEDEERRRRNVMTAVILGLAALALYIGFMVAHI